MRKLCLWAGSTLLGIGLAAICANMVLGYLGYSASYNLGDPAKFEFVLVPLWQIGVAAAAIGGACLLWSRRLAR